MQAAVFRVWSKCSRPELSTPKEQPENEEQILVVPLLSPVKPVELVCRGRLCPRSLSTNWHSHGVPPAPV